MAKYIDLDAAIALAKDIIVPIKSGYYYRHRCIDPQELAELPAADVAERKAGKWETDEIGCAICSVCGNYAFETTTHHISGWYPRFCPNCGAKMEVPTDV